MAASCSSVRPSVKNSTISPFSSKMLRAAYWAWVTLRTSSRNVRNAACTSASVLVRVIICPRASMCAPLRSTSSVRVRRRAGRSPKKSSGRDDCDVPRPSAGWASTVCRTRWTDRPTRHATWLAIPVASSPHVPRTNALIQTDDSAKAPATPALAVSMAAPKATNMRRAGDGVGPSADGCGEDAGADRSALEVSSANEHIRKTSLLQKSGMNGVIVGQRTRIKRVRSTVTASFIKDALKGRGQPSSASWDPAGPTGAGGRPLVHANGGKCAEAVPAGSPMLSVWERPTRSRESPTLRPPK